MKNEFSEISVKLTLGDNEYTVKFGIPARRRIEESCPGFNLLTDKMPDFEVVPFLITMGIPPADHKWKTEDEFIELFESCTDTEALSKIPLAFQNAMGFTNQLFLPVIERIQLTIKSDKTDKNTNSTGEITTEQPGE